MTTTTTTTPPTPRPPPRPVLESWVTSFPARNLSTTHPHTHSPRRAGLRALQHTRPFARKARCAQHTGGSFLKPSRFSFQIKHMRGSLSRAPRAAVAASGSPRRGHSRFLLQPTPGWCPRQRKVCPLRLPAPSSVPLPVPPSV